jgi:nitrite reductase/ring-hydroxylating ferredoxin subunit
MDSIIHISDIHIRVGNHDKSRYTEYLTVFNNLFQSLSSQESIKNNTAVIVITGDLFHHKNKLEPYGLELALHLFRGLSVLSSVFVIRGNHDYRQDVPNEKDMICVVDYDVITKNPESTMRQLYQFLGESYFNHDFDNVTESYDKEFVAFDGTPAVLFRTKSGVFAYSRVCTHQGCSVSYNAKNNLLICPCHNAQFDPTQDGAAIVGPTKIALPKIKVAIIGINIVQI